MYLLYRYIFSLSLGIVLVLSGCSSDRLQTPGEAATTEAILVPTVAASATDLLLTPTVAPLPGETARDDIVLLPTVTPTPLPAIELQPTATPNTSPMAIERLRARTYPSSDILTEETLAPGANYQRFIASYLSDDYRIYGLLTVPNGQVPEGGFPTILFLHGYVRPDTYQPTAQYVGSQDALARSGFVTFKPDLRGHGRSEGIASGGLFSEAYTVDALNAISALENYEPADGNRIGLWGHSNGGATGLRVMTITDKVKAGVFWAGVVGSYPDLLETYHEDMPFMPLISRRVLADHGMPSENPDYWLPIDPFTYLANVLKPIQLHHGTADMDVPFELSIILRDALLAEDKQVELYQYDGADHNLSGPAFGQAMAATIAFFAEHLQ